MKQLNTQVKSLMKLGLVIFALHAGPVLADVAGHAQFINGDVQVTDSGGRMRTLQKGDAINEGDTVTSAKAASAQIRMQDGGFVAVRQDTQLKFDSFKFSGKEGEPENSFFSLFKGGFRAVTGLIGRINKQNYRITTPVATIGIRGTDHESFYTPVNLPGALAGAYNKVNIGETSLTTDVGTINIKPNQMGYAGGVNQPPQLQPINANIFTVASTPDKEVKKEDKQDKEGQGVRESAVVDNTSQQQGAAPGPTVAAPGNVVTTNFIQIPITTTGGIVLTGGALFGSPAYAALNGYGYEALGIDALGNWINPWDSNLPGTSYILDAANNLIEVVGGISPGKVAGGVAKDTYVAADSSVYFGRWQGGTYTDQISLIPVALGNTSMQWVVTANPPVGYVQTLTGTTSYSLTAATHPTDKFGNVGTLTAAALTANFTTQIVNASLALSFSTADPVNISTQNKAFTVTTPSGISISGETIWGFGSVACTGASCDVAGYTADIWARFAASTANKVAIPYNIVGTTDLIQGVAMVTATTPPVVLPLVATAPYVQTDLAAAFATSSASYFYPFAQTTTFIAAPADLNNTLPNPSSVDRYAGNGSGNSITYTLNGTTTVGEAPTTIAATGIQFGRYNSTSSQQVVVGNTNCCLAGIYSSPPPATVYSHWIVGPAVNPVYLPEVLLATNATYTLAGGTVPTASFSPSASLTTASLSVNFTQQLVTFNLALTVGGNPWTASVTGAPLEIMYWNNAQVGFRASTAAQPGWAPLIVTGATSGDVVGQLTGNALNGALLSYLFNNSVNGDQVVGVAAFTGAAQNTATPYRIAALSTVDTIPVGMTGAGTAIPVTNGRYNNSASVLTDVAGNLTQFNSNQPFSNGAGGVTVNKGSAVVAGLGTDPVSGISWGRWVGGSLSVTNLATSVVTGAPNPYSSHWITGPVMTGPVDLPVSGTFNYVLAGGTAPTDSLGGVGTLNSASLSANFTAQTVSIGLNVTTPNAGNLVASGAAIPIEQKSFFNASTANSLQGSSNLGLLTVTGGTGTPSGNVGGVFVGAGGVGAGVVYGLSAGTVNVNGVAAFHR